MRTFLPSWLLTSTNCSRISPATDTTPKIRRAEMVGFYLSSGKPTMKVSIKMRLSIVKAEKVSHVFLTQLGK